jgi:hypothetical protein
VNASDDGASTATDYDKPSIAMSSTGEVLLTYADFTNASAAALVLARSADGKAFTKSIIANDATFGNLAYLCLDVSKGASATLYVAHLGANAGLTVHRSIDGGATWTSTALENLDVLFQDVTCVAKDNDVWVSYAKGVGYTPGENPPADSVQVLHSTDGAASFLAPTQVTAAGSDKYLFPKLHRSADGKLHIVEYSGQVGAPVNLELMSSDNQGASWTKSPLVPAGTFVVNRQLANWLGDYLGFSSAGTFGFVSYTENTLNKSHIAFSKISLP